MYITEKVIEEWQDFLSNRNYSIKTKNNYKSDLKIFLKWLLIQEWETIGSLIDLEKITLKRIENRTTYLQKIPTPKTSIYYTKQPTLSPATIQWKRVAVKSFLKFLNLMYDEWLDYRKIETKKVKSDYIECLTDTEYRTLFNFIDSYEKYKINALRMQLLCNIGYTSWLRLSEMLNLRIRDIEAKETRIIWKWNKARWVFFTPSTLEILDRYLVERGKPIPRTWRIEKKSDFVFVSLNIGRWNWLPIKKNVICDKMKQYSETLDIWKRITVHTLRHSYATRLLESWMNVMEIKELLGHSDIETTQTYCHVLKSQLKDKVGQIFE